MIVFHQSLRQTTLSCLVLLCSEFWNRKLWVLLPHSLFQDLFDYFKSLVILLEFENQVVNFYKKLPWDSASDWIESVDKFEYCCKQYYLPIHVHGCFSICVNLFWFLSTMIYSFQTVNTVHLLLSLSQSALLFFNTMLNKLVFVSFWIVHCQHIKVQLIFLFILYLAVMVHLIILINFWWMLWNFFTQDYVPCKQK